jgi:hypothetical protein
MHDLRTISFQAELPQSGRDHNDRHGVVAGASDGAAGVAGGDDSKFGGGGICRAGLVYLTPGIIFP